MDDMHVRERITDVLVVLSAIGAGSLEERLPRIADADDPFSALYEGINEVVDTLAASQARLETSQRELEERLDTIEKQRHAIRELSTPVIEVWEGVLCLPVVGVVDTVRSAEMTESLLRTVIDKKTRYAIVDVTGIEVMDTRTTDHFIRMARAVRLLGAECVLAGISAVIAQTIVHMGVDLAGLITFRTMREALHHYVQRQVVKTDKPRAADVGAEGASGKARADRAERAESDARPR